MLLPSFNIRYGGKWNPSTTEEGEEKRMISSSNMFQQLNSFPKMKYPYEYVDTHDVQEY